jgi:hypothetical protein
LYQRIGGIPEVYFELMRDLQEGEEVLVDYGATYWKYYDRKGNDS